MIGKRFIDISFFHAVVYDLAVYAPAEKICCSLSFIAVFLWKKKLSFFFFRARKNRSITSDLLSVYRSYRLYESVIFHLYEIIQCTPSSDPLRKPHPCSVADLQTVVAPRAVCAAADMHKLCGIACLKIGKKIHRSCLFDLLRAHASWFFLHRSISFSDLAAV